MYKDVFLDFDDTIYDTHGNANKALEELYDHFHLDRYFDGFDSFSPVYWRRNAEVWAMYSKGEMTRSELILERFLYPLRQVNQANESLALSMSDWFLDATAQKSGLIEGALDLLQYLKKRYRIHMISNGFKEVQYRKMESAGVTSFFDSVILSDEVGYNKPHPAIFDFALKQTGAIRKETIMIGDNFDTDIQGAMNSHIDQIFYNTHPEFQPLSKPTFQVCQLKDIREIL